MRVIAVAADERVGIAEGLIATLRERGYEVLAHGALIDARERSEGERGEGKGSERERGEGVGSEREDWAWASEAAARDVAEGRAGQAIVCCWTGTGASIAANKVRGVRAALCADAPTAAGARRWNDANVLALSLRSMSAAELEEILDAWFATAPSEEADDRANIARLAEIERAEGERAESERG